METQPPSPANPGGTAYVGSQNFHSAGSEFNAMSFLVRQILAEVSVGMPVIIDSIETSDSLGPTSVNVKPLVNQLDGSGNAVPHGIIYDVPVFRLQSGNCGIVLTPAEGDIGYAAFADRDISAVIKNRAQANPGSRRRFDMSDAMFFGGFVNTTPTQYILGNADGIRVKSPTKIFIDAPEAECTGNLKVDGNITATGNITAGQGGSDQVSLQTHKHPTAATGSPSSPTPGT